MRYRKTDRRYSYRRPIAFTLIEVLAVVAIIALLVSILLPSLSSARKKSRATVCLTNLHRLAHAVEFYLHNFNVYPPVRLTQVYNIHTTQWESFYLDIKNSSWRRKSPYWPNYDL